MFFFRDIWTLPAIGLGNQADGFDAPVVIALVFQKLFNSGYLFPSVLSGTIATAGVFLSLRLQSTLAPLFPYILITAIAAYYITVYFIEEGQLAVPICFWATHCPNEMKNFVFLYK